MVLLFFMILWVNIWEGLRWLVFLLHVASAGVNHLVTVSWQQTRLKDPRTYSFVWFVCFLKAHPCVFFLYMVFDGPVWSLQHGSLSPQRKQKWKLPRLLKVSPEWAPWHLLCVSLAKVGHKMSPDSRIEWKKRLHLLMDRIHGSHLWKLPSTETDWDRGSMLW